MASLRLTLFAWLGFGYVALVYLVVLTAIGWGVSLVDVPLIKQVPLEIWLVAGGLLLSHAITVRLDKPEELELRRDEAAPLFAMLDELRQQLNASPIDHVYITDNHSCFIRQSSSVQFFTPRRTMLFIGLPLLDALDTAQLRALLANTLVHLSHDLRHQRALIMRRIEWNVLQQQLEPSKAIAAPLFRPFFRWYVPRMERMFAPMMRQFDIDGDRLSATVVDAQTIATMLCRVAAVTTYFNEDFRKEHLELAKQDERPPQNLLSSMRDRLQQPDAIERLNTLLTDSVCVDVSDAEQANSIDTPIKQRVVALGVDPASLRLDVTTPATDVLGSCEREVVRKMNAQWREGLIDTWRSIYTEYQDGKTKLAEVEQRIQGDTSQLSASEYAEYILAIKAVYNLERAEPHLETFSQRFPNEFGPNYLYAKLLLERDDSRGIPLLEHAIRPIDGKYMYPHVLEALTILKHYYSQANDAEQVQRVERRLAEHLRNYEVDFSERNEFDPDRPLTSPNLSEEAVRQLKQQCAQFEIIEQLYVARIVTTYSHDPMYLLAVKLEGVNWRTTGQQVNEMLHHISDQFEFAEEYLLVNIDVNQGSLKPRLRKLEGSLIYSVR